MQSLKEYNRIKAKHGDKTDIIKNKISQLTRQVEEKKELIGEKVKKDEEVTEDLKDLKELKSNLEDEKIMLESIGDGIDLSELKKQVLSDYKELEQQYNNDMQKSFDKVEEIKNKFNEAIEEEKEMRLKKTDEINKVWREVARATVSRKNLHNRMTDKIRTARQRDLKTIRGEKLV